MLIIYIHHIYIIHPLSVCPSFCLSTDRPALCPCLCRQSITSLFVYWGTHPLIKTPNLLGQIGIVPWKQWRMITIFFITTIISWQKTVAVIIKTMLCEETGMYTNANLPTPCPSLVTSGAKGTELQEPAKDTTRKAVPQLLHQVATKCSRDDTRKWDNFGRHRDRKTPKTIAIWQILAYNICKQRGFSPKKNSSQKEWEQALQHTGLAALVQFALHPSVTEDRDCQRSCLRSIFGDGSALGRLLKAFI